ncbi:hypothetical protein V3C99_000548 [Haemonchus contortus]
MGKACCRRPQPSPTTPASVEDTTTTLPIKVKSPQKQAQIIIETYQDFDEKKTSIYMKAIRSLAELHARRVSYDPQKIDAKPMNISGKFAVVFTIYDVECGQLRDFITTVEGLSERTKKVTIKCGGRTTYLL